MPADESSRAPGPGLAILAGVSATITAGTGGSGPQSLVDGYHAALLVGAGVLIAAAALAVLTLSHRGGAEEQSSNERAPHVARV